MAKVFSIKSDLKEIARVINEILGDLKRYNLKNEVLHDIKLAVEEAIINAIKHGNKFRQELSVRIGFEHSQNKVKISVEDCGEGYDYKRIPDPTLDENIAKGHGRGVFLIKKLMDEVNFNARGNRIEVVKYINRNNQ